MRIDPTSRISNPALDQLAGQAGGGSSSTQKAGDDFAQTLMDVLKEVNASQQDARKAQNSMMTGQPVDYHDLMIAMEKASISMQLTMAVRNKVLEAYQEITRMQV